LTELAVLEYALRQLSNRSTKMVAMADPYLKGLTPTSSTNRGGAARIVAINSPTAPQKPKLLEQVRHAIRIRHLSPRTEQAYVGWIKRFIFFHNKRHPAEMGEAEIGQFLSSLATDSRVSASTQNQALNALLFLYNKVLEKKIGLRSREWSVPIDPEDCPSCSRRRK